MGCLLRLWKDIDIRFMGSEGLDVSLGYWDIVDINWNGFIW